jgi:hypothetical protein
MGDQARVNMAEPKEQIPAVVTAAAAARGDNLRHIRLSDFWPPAPQLGFS